MVIKVTTHHKNKKFSQKYKCIDRDLNEVSLILIFKNSKFELKSNFLKENYIRVKRDRKEIFLQFSYIIATYFPRTRHNTAYFFFLNYSNIRYFLMS